MIPPTPCTESAPEEAAEDSPAADPAPASIGFEDLHEELIASTSENRRGNRRMLEILKGFGTMLEAISATALDTHKAVRAIPSTTHDTSSSSDDWRLSLVDLADRTDRIRAGFERTPDTPAGWWPPARKAAAAWREAWDTQSAALSILHSHIGTLLERANLRRMTTLGNPFDPHTMTAVEAIVDPSVPDHTVVVEVLPGWRCDDSGRIVRLAHVKVSRKSPL